MSGNFCHAHHWWDGRPLYTYSGELYVQIEWSVLNTLTKDIVLKKKTSGYFKQDNPIKNGIAVSFDNAFANAAEKFASINSMRKLATGEQIKTAGNSSNLETVSIMQGQETKNFNLENVQSKVVTIRIGRGHGSGFFVGDKGYLLTNAHVVGDANKVRILTNQGLEIDAVVISKNKVRDVAILKTPLGNNNPLSLDNSNI